MTLPLDASLLVGPTRTQRYGIAVALYHGADGSDVEIERAPDASGAPDTGAAETVAIVPPATLVYVDELPVDAAALYWYRIRAVGAGLDPSAWTCWRQGTAGPLPWDFGRPAPVEPQLTVTRDSTAAVGTVTVTLEDPQCRVTEVAFRTKVGGGAYSSWTPDASAPYSTTVAITAGVFSLLGWRVTGYDAAGTLRVLAEGEEVFDGGHLVAMLAVVPTFDEDGGLTVRVVGDANTASIRVAVSPSAFPSSGTVAAVTAVNGRQSEWTFAGPYALGSPVYISAIGYSAASGGGVASDKIDALTYRSNSATSKTIRMSAVGLLQGSSEAVPFTVVNGYVRNQADSVNMFAFLPVPKGATITAVRARLWGHNSGGGGGGDICQIGLSRVDDSGGLTAIGSLAVITVDDTWRTATISSLSESTAGARSYQLLWDTLKNTGGTAPEWRCAWIEYDIDVPNVDVST